MEAGLDSLGAVELRNALSAHFSVELPATVTFDHPTPAALAAFLAASLGAGDGNATADGTGAVVLSRGSSFHSATSDLDRVPSRGRAATSVVGISCRYPAPAADGAAGFFAAMSASADLPRLIPIERWDLEPLYSPEVASGRMYARFAACMDGVDAFDGACFGMPRAEALATDPQSRLLLEEVHAALAGAGGTGAYYGTEGGFYVGCMYQEYTDVLARSGGKLSSATATGNSLSFMAGRWGRLTLR